MATYTRENLVRDSLLEIRVIGANEAPDADDAALTDDRAQQVLEDLYEEGLIPFDLQGEIPAAYYLPLVKIVANELVLPFGKSAREEYQSKADRAKRRLHGLRQRAYVPTTTPATYF